jgi:hypothetical protein
MVMPLRAEGVTAKRDAEAGGPGNHREQSRQGVPAQLNEAARVVRPGRDRRYWLPDRV